MNNLYSILGVEQNATEAEIKKAFRTLSKKYHPDVNPGDKRAEERFREISEAYAVLRDSQKRSDYDKKLKEGQRNASSKASDRKRASADSNVSGVDFRDMERQFAQFFGFDPKISNQKPAKDHEAEKVKANPIDMTDLFEKYMGISK